MYKPIYHYFPGKNWMNDPNGVCWYGGKYHLFYQYNPQSDQWGNLHWGHAVSDDCIHWKHCPEALFPSTELGETHCFSGCASTDGKLPILYYTSVGEEKDGRDSRYGAQQWCAISEDGMYTWEKYEGNPILTKEIHGDLPVLEWRDPFVWKEDDGWYMVLGAEIEGRGNVLLYYSKDQFHWKFIHVLMKSDRPKDRILECPNYFILNGKAVLVVSPDDMPCYWMGTQKDGHVFCPETFGIIDHSGWDGFYAPNSFVDPKGRRIMIGWLTEKSRGDLKIPGWQGVQSLPRELTVEKDGLHMRPIDEVKSLRGKGEIWENLVVNGIWESPLSSLAAEIVVELEIQQIHSRFEIQVYANEDGTEETTIRYNPDADEIVIDRSRSNSTMLTDSSPLTVQGTHSEEGKLQIRSFIDHSTLEVYINEREVISTRIYPNQEDSCQIRFRTEHECVIRQAEIYLLNGI